MAIYKRSRGVELGDTAKQLQLVVRKGLEPATTPPDFKSGALTTRSRCLLFSSQPGVLQFNNIVPVVAYELFPLCNLFYNVISLITAVITFHPYPVSHIV